MPTEKEKLVTLVVPANAMPRQVDDFSSDCARSCEGALHVRPASNLVVTPDEWAHLKTSHPHIADKMIEAKPTRRVRTGRQVTADKVKAKTKKAKLAPRTMMPAPEPPKKAKLK